MQGIYYSLIYSTLERRYYYIGIDGKKIAIDLRPSDGEMFHIQHFSQIRHEIKDKSPEAKDTVRQVADNAVKGIIELSEECEISKESNADSLKQFGEMSTEEAIKFWGSLSGHFVTHVTRYGIRDQSGGPNSAGESQWMQPFINILQRGKLITAREARNILGNDIAEYKETAENISNAIFFAPELVDQTYGGEHGNSPMFVIPAEVALEICSVSGNTKGWQPDDAPGWPVLEVMPEREGIDLQDTFLFIPEDARVDPKTGSSYEVDNNNKPIVDLRNIEATKILFQQFSDTDPQSQEDIHFGELGFPPNLPMFVKGNLFYNFFQARSDYNYELTQTEEQKLRERDLKSQAILDVTPQNIPNSIIDYLLRSDALFKRPDKTISSREYWEEYLKKHPTKSKVVYFPYDRFHGSNMNGDLRQFMQTHNIPCPIQKGNGELVKNPRKLQIPPGSVIDIRRFETHEKGTSLYGLAHVT